MQRKAQHKPGSSSGAPRRRHSSKLSGASSSASDGIGDGDDPLLDEDVGPPHFLPAEQRLVAAWLLKKHPVLFGDLPMASMLALAKRLKIYRPAVGQLVTLQGDIGRAFYLIVRGKAEVRLVSSRGSGGGGGSGGRNAGRGEVDRAGSPDQLAHNHKKAPKKRKGLASLLHKSRSIDRAAEMSALSVDPAKLDALGPQGQSMDRLNAAVKGGGMSLSWDTGKGGGSADR